MEFIRYSVIGTFIVSVIMHQFSLYQLLGLTKKCVFSNTWTSLGFVRFEALRAVTMKNGVF
jgi:hypothetical protein